MTTNKKLIRRKISMVEEAMETTKKRNYTSKGNTGKTYQDRITRQQILFCYEFVNSNFNQTKAALAANYSKRSASQIANRLLKQDKIQEKINEIMQKKMSEIDVTTTDVVQELKLLAFSDIKNILSWDDKQIAIVPSSKLKEFSKCIKSISLIEKEIPFEIGKGQTTNTILRKVRIELHDKLKALELIGKNLKMFTDKVEMSGNIECLVIDGDDDEEDSTADTPNKSVPRNHPKHYNFSEINAKRKADKLKKDDNAS